MNDIISKSEALRRIENFMHVAGGNAAVQMCYEIIQNIECKIFLIGCDFYNMDDAAIIKGYILGTEEDAKAYCAELNKEDPFMNFEYEELDCLNPEKIPSHK